MCLIPFRVNGVRLPDAPDGDLLDRGTHGNSGCGKGITHQPAEFLVGLSPLRPLRRAWQFRAKHCEMLRSLAIAVILGFRQPRDWNSCLGEIVGVKFAELLLRENEVNQYHGSILNTLRRP